MSRAALRSGLAIAGILLASGAGALDPHLDPGLVPEGCPSCHLGHGAPMSPMLGKPQSEVCLSCHGPAVSRNAAVMSGLLAADARPRDLSSVAAQPFVHPIDTQAYSRHGPGVTCTSCHSPHRGMDPQTRGQTLPRGVQKPSPRNPVRAEFELCASCHGGTGVESRDPVAVGGRIDPRNPSYHPLEAPARDGSQSVAPSLSGQMINCTDCHGNSDPGGVRGPHGSAERSILRSRYDQFDGRTESEETYSLCYGCHIRDRVLASLEFPPHYLHVVEQNVSCSTCHDAHGSAENRGLIRFGGRAITAGVGPSASAGVLAFRSSASGSGTCYLTCHGFDHAPESYGGLPADASAVLGAEGVGRAERPGRDRPDR